MARRPFLQAGIAVLALATAAACSNSTLPGDTVASGGSEDFSNLQPGDPGADASGAAASSAGAPTGARGPAAVGRTGSGTGSSTGGSSGGGSSTGGSSTGGPSTRGSSVGVTKDTISISVSGRFSGPYATFVEKEYTNGLGTWIEDVNASGGIHGRKIVPKKVDNLATSEGAIAACKEEQTNGTLMTLWMVSDDPEVDCADKAGVPGLHYQAQRDSEPWKVARGMTSGPAAGRALASFMKGKLGAAGKKVGFIVTTAVMHTAIGQEFSKKAAGLGLNVVAREVVPEGQNSFVAELSRMRSAGTEMVAVITGTEILGVLRDAKAMNYQPTWTGFGWALDEVSQAAQGLMTGIKALRFNAATDSPAYKAFHAKATKYRKAGITDIDSAGYALGLQVGHFLTAAGPNLTRESLVAAMDSTRSFDAGIFPPISYHPPDRIGTRAYFPGSCCHADGTWASFGPAQENF